jgi:hypothetical protein
MTTSTEAEADPAPPGALPGVVNASLVDPGDGPMSPPSGGLRPRAQKVRAIALELWGCETRPSPCVAVVGGYAYRNIAGTNTLSNHALGKAADIMVPDYRSAGAIAMGDEMAAYFVANADALGLTEVIWRDRIWTVSRRSEGWRPYRHSGGGGDTLQHRDHVHVSTL